MVDFLKQFEQQERPFWEDERKDFPVRKNRKVFKLISGFLVFIILAGYIFTIGDEQTRAATGINKTINFQGKLTDSSSVTVADGAQSITFRIYDASTGGSCLYSARGTCGAPTAKSITVTNGIFSTLIGESGDNDLSAVDFNSDSLFLGVKISSDSEMTPRIRLGSTAYAFNTDTLDGLDSGSFLRSDTSDTAFGLVTFNATPTGTGVSTGSLYVNATTTTSNLTLFGVAANGSERFRVDMEGDVFASSSIFASGAINSATTTATSTFSGDVAVQGNIRLGDATSDLVDVTARFTTSLLPAANNAIDLGAFGNAFRDIYVSSSIRVGTSGVGSSTLSPSSLTINGSSNPSITIGDASSGATVSTLTMNTNARQAYFQLDNTSNVFTISNGGPIQIAITSNISPSSNNVVDLGTTGLAWKNLYASGTAYLGHTVPSGNNIYDLGSATSSWRDVYASGTTRLGGNLIPNPNNSIDIGAFGTAFRDIYASGTFRIGAASNAITIDPANILGPLISTGAATLNIQTGGTAKNININPSGSASISTLGGASIISLIVSGSGAQAANVFEVRPTGGDAGFWVNGSGGIGASSTVYITSPLTNPGIDFSATGSFRATTTDIAANAIFTFNTPSPAPVNADLLRLLSNGTTQFSVGPTGVVSASGTIQARGSGSSTFTNGLVAGTLGVTGSGTSTSISGAAHIGVLNITSTSATSTFANGIQLNGGCFRDANGACFITGNYANTALSNLASVAINTSLLSDANNTDDLGSYAFSWRDVYASGTLYASSTLVGFGKAGAPTYSFDGDTDTGMYRSAANEVSIASNGSQVFKVVSGSTASFNTWAGLTGAPSTSHLIITSTDTENLRLRAGTSGPSNLFTGTSDTAGTTITSWLTAAGGFNASGTSQFSHLVPSQNNAYDLGSATSSWRDFYASGTTRLGGNLIPNPNNSVDLGAFSNAWRDIYASSSIRIGNGSASTTIGSNGNISLTGAIYAGVGAQTAPSFSFTGDTDTGMYSSADTLRFTTAGVQRLAMSSVSIGLSGSVPLVSATNNGSDLGATDQAFKSIFASGTAYLGHTIPSGNNIYDLGSATSSWRNVYASGTIYASTVSPGTGSGTTTYLGGVNARGLESTNGITLTQGALLLRSQGTTSTVQFTGSGTFRSSPTDAAGNAAFEFNTTGAVANADLFNIKENGVNSFRINKSGNLILSRDQSLTESLLFFNDAGDVFIHNNNGNLRVQSTQTDFLSAGTVIFRAQSESSNLRFSVGTSTTFGAALNIDTNQSGNKGLHIRGSAGTPTVNYIEVATQSGTTADPLFWVNQSGGIGASSTSIIGNNSATTFFANTVDGIVSVGTSSATTTLRAFSQLFVQTHTINEAALTGLIIRDGSGSSPYVEFQTSDGDPEFRVDTTGGIFASGTAAFQSSSVTRPIILDPGTITIQIATSSNWANTARLRIDTAETTERGIVVRGVPSQTAALQEWHDAFGTRIAMVMPSGVISSSSTIITSRQFLQSATSTGITTNLFQADDSTGKPLFWVNFTGGIGSSGTLYVSGAGTSTFLKGVQVDVLDVATTTATSTFQGSVSIGGSLRISGQCAEAGNPLNNCSDLAESYPASEPVEPGELVMLEPSGPVPTVKKTDGSYAETIIGVVSSRPGAVLGGSGIELGYGGGDPMNPAIALAGRVPVKVSTENGDINPGDYLTSSSEPGIAMKATQAGTVIGRALESFDGAGEEGNKILVLVHTGWFGGLAPSEAEGSTSLNQASETSLAGSATLSELNMEGDINMNGHLIRNIGGLVALGDIWKVDEKGDFVTKGTFATEVETTDGKSKKFYALGSPDVEFHISGSGILQNGEALIEFDAETAASISPEIPLKVSVTLTDQANGVFVTEKTTSGFKVKELANGTSNATFDWVVIARRKGYEVLGENQGLAEGSASSTGDGSSTSLTTGGSGGIDGGGGTPLVNIDGGGGTGVDGGLSSGASGEGLIDGGAGTASSTDTGTGDLAAIGDEPPPADSVPPEEEVLLTPGG